MKYLKELEQSYLEYNAGADSITPRIVFLAEEILNIQTSADEDIASELGFRCVEVISAVSNSIVESYLGLHDEYRWFNIVRNMTFFSNRVISIGGHDFGWDEEAVYEIEATCLSFEGKVERGEFDYKIFTYEEWREFMDAIMAFIGTDIQTLRRRYKFK